MIVQRVKPRFVIAKVLPSGTTAFYFNVPKRCLASGCPNLNQPLGTDYVEACGTDGNGGKAAALNARFDEWQMIAAGIPLESRVQIGTVD